MPVAWLHVHRRGLSVCFLIYGLLSSVRSLAIARGMCDLTRRDAQDYCWKENGFAMVERCALERPCNAIQCSGRRSMVHPCGAPHRIRSDIISRAARVSHGGREAQRQPLEMHCLSAWTAAAAWDDHAARETCACSTNVPHGIRTWQLLLVRACVEPGQRV